MDVQIETTIQDGLLVTAQGNVHFEGVCSYYNISVDNIEIRHLSGKFIHDNDISESDYDKVAQDLIDAGKEKAGGFV